MRPGFMSSVCPDRTLAQLIAAAEKYGYELDLIPIDWPGIEQTAAWLQMRRNKPDWAFLWGWGASNQVAIKSATLINSRRFAGSFLSSANFAGSATAWRLLRSAIRNACRRCSSLAGT